MPGRVEAVETLPLVDDDPSDGTDLRDRLVAGLNGPQRRAVEATSPVVRILAGAGSGKTRVLTHRIALRVSTDEIDPRRVLAVTFTRKAASELRSRLDNLLPHSSVTAGTFHSIAYAQLRQRWNERGITPPTLLDRKVGFVARLMGSRSSRSSTAPLDAVSEIEWAKARMISANDYPVAARRQDRRSSLEPDVIAEIFERYEHEKLERRMVDFDDLLRLATRDLRADEAYAAARRWRYRHVFVDEFQDVNPLQFELLRAWAGDDPDICVVGDPNQAIYSWNGADARYLVELDSMFDEVETVELRDNYRSSPQILGVANAVLSQTRARAFDLVPHMGDGPLPTITAYASEAAEARAVAQALRDAHAPGARWADQAVLVRTNAQATAFEEALTGVGIPYRSRGGAGLLSQPEVRDVISRLRKGGGSLRTVLRDVQTMLDTTETDRDPQTADTEGTGERLTEERAANLGELVRLGREFLDLDPEGSSGAFVAWVTQMLGAETNSSSRDAVDLATFHAAKGLEWPIVHICGLEEGFAPISHAKTDDALAEEHRLLYVALTRAQRHLHVSWCETRTFGERTAKRTRSPYLDIVEFALDTLREHGAVDDMADRIAAERARLSAATPRRRPSSRKTAVADLAVDDRELFDVLRAWRAERARAASVPAFVVFNDATLVEVCRRRPVDRRQLLDVPGIGPVKAQQWGEELLRLVAQGS